jgi:hypothetical protein
VATQVFRRRHRDPAQRRQWPGDQAHVADPTETHGGVEAFLGEVDQAIGHRRLDLQLRVAPRQFAQHRHDHDPPERLRGGDLQRTARRALAVHQQLLDFLQFRQQGCAALVEQLAVRGQADAAGGAVQQTHAEFGFQPADGARQAGLGQTERNGGLGEATGLGHAGEQLDGIQVHGDLIDDYFHQ